MYNFNPRAVTPGARTRTAPAQSQSRSGAPARRDWLGVLTDLGGSALIGGAVGVGAANLGIAAYEAIQNFFADEVSKIENEMMDLLERRDPLQNELDELNARLDELKVLYDQAVQAKAEAANENVEY